MISEVTKFRDYIFAKELVLENSFNQKINMEKPIYVTQPSLPDLEEFIPYLRKIWDNKILTNNGPMHKELEKELASFLGVPYISLFANGTLALVTALQALRITGEVITTPYSFVATTTVCGGTTSNRYLWTLSLSLATLIRIRLKQPSLQKQLLSCLCMYMAIHVMWRKYRELPISMD